MDRPVGAVARVAVPVLAIFALILFARFRPGYFLNVEFLAGLIVLQVLVLCLWFYDRLFFPFLMLAFLWAGMDVPMTAPWTSARWVVLAAGAFVGFVRALRLGIRPYRAFHLFAFFCVASATVSATVSSLATFSLLKALSLLLLFTYGASGARLLLRNPDRFFRGLLLACELNAYLSAFAYLVLHLEIWGNPNSLGAVQGVVVAPLMLWGALVAPERRLRIRRALACLLAIYLVYFSITRAALLASAVAMVVLLIGLRRHKLLWQGVVGAACVVAVTAIVAPQRFEDLQSSVTNGVIYKGHREQGLLGSRLTPWQQTMDVIRESPYFGGGFGVSISGDKAFGEGGRFSSSWLTNREHGSSYLAILEWVGLLGILPFFFLILILVHSIARVYLWLRKTGNPAHYSIPVMMVLVSGVVHAAFEDWMFAVGYYLTIFFWTLAFLLMDLMPEPAAQRSTVVHGMSFPYAANPAAGRQ